MRLRTTPGWWPYTYDITQEFRLSALGLAVRMTAANLGPEAMPFGFGLHPYFPRTPHCRLEANVTGLWEADAAVLPLRHAALRPELDLRRGVPVNSVVCDTVFTGWDGRASLTWPEHATRLRMTAEPAMGNLCVYIPRGESYLCVEPVSNITDAFNRAAAGATDTGLIVLEPGHSISADVTFSAEAI